MSPTGWVMLRLWLVVGLTLPALGLGSWAARSAPIGAPQIVAEGVHAGAPGRNNPVDVPQEVPLPGQSEDTEDSAEGSEDAKGERLHPRTRSANPAVRCEPELGLERVAAAAGHGLADRWSGGPGASHRDQIHNRGPPQA